MERSRAPGRASPSRWPRAVQERELRRSRKQPPPPGRAPARLPAPKGTRGPGLSLLLRPAPARAFPADRRQGTRKTQSSYLSCLLSLSNPHLQDFFKGERGGAKPGNFQRFLKYGFFRCMWAQGRPRFEVPRSEVPEISQAFREGLGVSSQGRLECPKQISVPGGRGHAGRPLAAGLRDKHGPQQALLAFRRNWVPSKEV